MSPGNRFIDKMLDAHNGQELAHCWFESVGRRDGLLLFEQKVGRLPTEAEVRASGMDPAWIEYALGDLWDLIAWRRWNRDHEAQGALVRIGYRDNAREDAPRPFPPPADAPARRPGRLRRLLDGLLGLLADAYCTLDNLGRKVPLWRRLRPRHRVADPVLEQRVHEDAGPDRLRWVTDDAEAEPSVAREGLQ